MKKCLGCGKNNRRSVNMEVVVVEFVGAYCIDCYNKPDTEPLDEGLIREQVDRLNEQDRQSNIMKFRENRAQIAIKKKQFEI